jgi:bacterial/archaeal transporter family-2 protein
MYVLAAAAGAANPAQAGANAELRKTLQQAVFAGIAVYLSGLAGVLFIQLIVRQPWPGAEKLAHTPWWAWTGGAISIASTLAGITLAQRMGSGFFTGVSVTASLVTSMVLDNWGLLGFKEHPASWPRIVGCALMIAGVWLIARF